MDTEILHFRLDQFKIEEVGNGNFVDYSKKSLSLISSESHILK